MRDTTTTTVNEPTGAARPTGAPTVDGRPYVRQTGETRGGRAVHPDDARPGYGSAYARPLATPWGTLWARAFPGFVFVTTRGGYTLTSDPSLSAETVEINRTRYTISAHVRVDPVTGDTSGHRGDPWRAPQYTDEHTGALRGGDYCPPSLGRLDGGNVTDAAHAAVRDALPDLVRAWAQDNRGDVLASIGESNRRDVDAARRDVDEASRKLADARVRLTDAKRAETRNARAFALLAARQSPDAPEAR